MYPRDDKVNDLEIGTEKEETFDTNNAPEFDGSILNLVKNSPKVTLAEIVLEKNRNLAPDPKQKSVDMDCHNGKWGQNEVGAERDETKTFTYPQNLADMDLDYVTFALGCHYKNIGIKMNGLCCPNEIETDMEE
ncbi:hypothetical protein F8M41_015988 [Gigaspora margarita]|uniref:Uncharacterized protein n=1 Tax=Gigaspora margarita TaxID=4874 RepID=A0A8H4EUS3_GIGMA|nr:hypothetical protein F8M41_015988 [Gigaspora margarita]